jgi:16S rRNA (cytosine967-C5)-methyltransferase
MIAPARRAAFDALQAIAAGDVDLATAMAQARRRLPDARDRALAAEITTGTLRWLGRLDHLIAHYARRPVERLDAPVLQLLRLGAYQVTRLERVPVSAVVNDAVELAKQAGARGAAGLVNAVLRAIARERNRLPLPPEPPAGPDQPRDAALDYLSITLSHPRWLVERWLDRAGFDDTKAWALFNNSPAPLTLRANLLKTTVPELREALAQAGVETDPARYSPHALVVRRGNPLRTPLSEPGMFGVQDEASQLVALFAGARPGQRVLDLCAAPGNKTLALAADMRDEGLIVAADLRERRLRLLRRTVASGGARAAHLVRLDATRPLPLRSGFDLVFVDAPCSGLGTIRRDPEIRWRRTAGDLAPLADTQLKILGQAADVVAPGGRVVYATCSSEPEENERVVTRFLAERSEFRLADPRVESPPLSAALTDVLDDSGCLRTLPWRHGLEGFFAAMLVKAKHL